MITILGITLTYETLAFFLLFIASEVIGTNPKLAENSVAQLIVKLAFYLKPLRKEDNKLNQIRDTLRQ